MKKRFVKILSLLVATLIGSSAFAGCNLVTTDIDRDMDRVVATVNVTREETITKRDMVMQYMNYGQLYVQYYGYSQEQVYELILDNLLQTRIMAQYVEKAFTENPSKYGVSINTAEEGIAKFLKADDVIEAKYNTYKTINDLLEAYKTHNHEEDEKQDTVIGEVRTAPTGAANKALELSPEQKEAYVKKYEANGFSLKTAEEITAYNKVIDALDSYSLLGDFKNDLRKSTYFTGTLKANQENILIKYFEDDIRNDIISELSYKDDIVGLYNKTVEEQKEMSNKEFVSALSSATITSPILVSNKGSYGYVYNILLGASTKQTEDIAKIRTDNPNIPDSEFATKRAEILADTIVKDLRTSWIRSGFDFDGTKFTGDYTLVKNAENSLPFKGTVTKIKDEVKDEFGAVTENAKYAVDSVTEFGLSDFMTMVETYVGGTFSTETYAMDYAIDVPYAKSLSAKGAEYDAKIQELLFAFSTDPGSLNTYKGYLIKPPVDGADSEEFVKTFGDAGRELISKGAGYVVVASDYGYHLMFYSEKIDVNYGFASLDEYLNTLGIDNNGLTWDKYFEKQLKDWDKFVETDNYLYYLANSLVTERIGNETENTRNNVINKYRYEEEGGVVIDQKVYDSLLGK